jgi:hypothetical protein
MFKVFSLVIILLAGCSTTSYRILTPPEVSNIPIDCWNKNRINGWLTEQLQFAEKDPKSNGASINAIKHKIWQLRTDCSNR